MKMQQIHDHNEHSGLHDAAQATLGCLTGALMSDAAGPVAGPVIGVTYGIRPFIMRAQETTGETLRNMSRKMLPLVHNAKLVFVFIFQKGAQTLHFKR